MKIYFIQKIKSLLTIILIGLFLVSCSKTNDAPPSICYLSAYSGTYDGTYTYSNNKLSASTEYGTDATYIYDQKGNIVTINYSGGSVENYLYDANNRKIQITSPNQYQLKYIYNLSGQLTKRESYTYNGTSSTYDLSSYIIFEYAAATSKNWTALTKYDASDNPMNSTTFQYDSKKNPWAIVWGTSSVETENNPTQQVYTPAGGAPVTTTISYTYNSNGFPLTATSVTGSTNTAVAYTYINCK